MFKVSRGQCFVLQSRILIPSDPAHNLQHNIGMLEIVTMQASPPSLSGISIALQSPHLADSAQHLGVCKPREPRSPSYFVSTFRARSGGRRPASLRIAGRPRRRRHPAPAGIGHEFAGGGSGSSRDVADAGAAPDVYEIHARRHRRRLSKRLARGRQDRKHFLPGRLLGIRRYARISA